MGLNYTKLTAIMRLKSGEHTGSGEKGHYGEPLSVIKSLRTQLPYLPGSSIKGKMRHLLEITTGKTTSGKPCGCGNCQICLLFGSGESLTTKEPSRLIFRDCFLTGESAVLIEKIGTEKKAGVRIDRTTGKAADKALYSLERVPEGAEFNMEISCRIFEKDQVDGIKKWLLTGLYLIEQDAIGGGGTRGSGWIEFDKVTFDDKQVDTKWKDEVKKDIDKLTNVKIKKQ